MMWISTCSRTLTLIGSGNLGKLLLGMVRKSEKKQPKSSLKKWRDGSHHAESTSQAINQNATKTKVCPHSKTWNTEYTMSFSRLKIVKWFTPLPKATNPRGKKTQAFLHQHVKDLIFDLLHEARPDDFFWNSLLCKSYPYGKTHILTL